jgi:hypothetical protein
MFDAADRPVVVAGDTPLLALAGEVLASQRVPVRRVLDPSRAGISGRAALLLLAEGPELPQRLQQAGAASRGRRRPLRVVVLRPRAVADHTEAEDNARDRFDDQAGESGLQLEWLDVDATAARALLSRWPLHRTFDPPYQQRPHLLIAGFGPFARAYFLQALRVGQYGERPPVVTLLAEPPDTWRDWIAASHPQADACAELRFGVLSAPDLDGAPPLSTAIVCGLSPAAGLGLGRRLVALAAERGASPLVLLAADADWPTDWLRGDLPDWDGQLVPVQPVRVALSRDVLLEGRDDALAEVVHEHYRDTSAAQGRDPAAAPSGRPWALLATSYRDANRHQADHLWAKLAVTDCRAVPEEMVESFAFAPAEVERLAIIEHRRWAVDRWLDGWRYGSERDNARKLHPQLIPYADLSDAMQDLDRFAVRLVPALLARSGLGVVRRLIVGVRGGDPRRSARALDGAVHRVLTRLAARYPDRGLTLALDPADAAARRVATAAVSRFGAGLFLLLPTPLSRMLAAQPAAERAGVLGLLAGAERRVQLAGEAAVAHWLAHRAEILFALDEAAFKGLPEIAPLAKRVHLDARGAAHWNFEF